MTAGLIVVHFGEPATPDPSVVQPYLHRIFRENMDLEEHADPDERAATLAARRTPSLIAEYEAIGGSPLQDQAVSQVAALRDALAERGHPVTATTAFQFTDPSIADGIETLRSAGCSSVIGLSLYPLCGQTTTLAASAAIDHACASYPDWEPAITHITGWHRHPAYLRLRAQNLSSFLAREDLDVHNPGTHMLWSAHGTPMKHVDAGSRYVQYVEEVCTAVGALAAIPEGTIGYQNHDNRGIQWTTPSIETVLQACDGDRVVVEPVSFMHEQSETLGDLDIELAETAKNQGIAMHRVPVPHDHPAFAEVLADLVEPFIAGVPPALYQLRPCACRSDERTFCRNRP